MQPQSRMRPPMQQQGGESAGAFSPEDIQEIATETGFPPERVRQDIARTHVESKEQLYANFYGGTGVEPMQPAQGGMPVAPPPMQSPAEESVEPPQSAPQEAAEGEGLSPEGVAAMQMAMRHAGPTGRRRNEPPPMRRGA